MLADATHPHSQQMDQINRPKRNKFLPARFATGDCDLYDFHPSSDNQEHSSTTQSHETSLHRPKTNTISHRASLAHLQNVNRRAHIMTIDRTDISRASFDSAVALLNHDMAQSPMNTSKAAFHDLSDKDSAINVKRTRRGKRIGRPSNLEKVANSRTEAETRLCYLDGLLTLALVQERKENSNHNSNSFWLYGRTSQDGSAPITPARRRDGEVVGKTGFVVRPPEPRFWSEPRYYERAHYQQKWESTAAAQAFDATYTEADDFSTSDEDETPRFSAPATSEDSQDLAVRRQDDNSVLLDPPSRATDRLDLISLLDLNDTLARHVLSTFLKDCVSKYGSPGWFRPAQTILRLTPEEEDWMENNRLRCLEQSGVQEDPDEETNTWHYQNKRYFREERRTHLDQDPEKALVWLEEDYKEWFCTKAEVKHAILYLLQRGYAPKMAEGINFGQFLEVESDEDDEMGGADERESGHSDEGKEEDHKAEDGGGVLRNAIPQERDS